MTYIKSLLKIIITFNILILYTYASDTYNITNNNLEYTHYLSAKQKLSYNNYKNAIKKLEQLNKDYPLNSYSNQIYIDLIYAYYKSEDFLLAQKTINTFIELNPNHPNLDYPLYIRGLINMESDNNNLAKKIFNLNNSEKNTTFAHEAFHNFSRILNQYPNSKYALDSYKRLIFLKNRISKHELAIIKYYSKHEAYIAVINRAEEMLKYFPDTEATYNALQYMYTAYQKLHLINQANKVMKIIIYNKKNFNN